MDTRSALHLFAANLAWQGLALPGLLLPREKSGNKKTTGETLADQSREAMKV